MDENPMTDSIKSFFKTVRDGDVAEVNRLTAFDPSLVHELNPEYFNGTALNMAAGRNDRAMVDALIDAGADLELKSDWWAGPWSAVQSALNYGHDELAAHLIDRGAKLDVHGAAGLGRRDVLCEMLDQDRSLVSATGGDGCQPLHFAGTTECAASLLERGAEIDARDVDHFSTPAQYLCKHRPEVSRYLLDSGSAPDIFVAVISSHFDQVTQLIKDEPSVLDWRIDQSHFPPGPDHDVHNIMTFLAGANSTPLQAAAAADRVRMIDLLVELGTDVNQTGGYDESTALHVAAWNNHTAAVDRLLALGADPNRRSGEQHHNSPAGWAIVSGAADAFELLLDHGAELLEFFADDAGDALSGRFREFGNRDEAAQQRIQRLIEQRSK